MILVSFAVAIPVGAVTPSVSTNKSAYAVGESIIVSAQSDNALGKDWIGIVPKGVTEDGTIAWEYLNQMGSNYDITKSANRNQNETLEPYQDFPAGRYVVYLVPDDLTLGDAIAQNKILASAEISVASDPNLVLNAPLSVTYAIDDVNSGLADGTLTITLPENHGAEDIYMWWADDNGILDGYTRLARFKVPSGTTQFTHKMTPNTLIPSEATKLLVYTYSDGVGTSGECFEVALSNGAGYDFPKEEPLIEFQVVSDIHIGRSESAANFKNALLDITQTCPNSSGIFANGGNENEPDSGNESGNESGNADTGNATSDINAGTGDSTSSGNSINSKKGCGSTVASVGALIVCAIGSAAVLKKKRR